MTNTGSPVARIRCTWPVATATGFSTKTGRPRSASDSTTSTWVSGGVATTYPWHAGRWATESTTPAAPPAPAPSRAEGAGSATTTSTPRLRRSRRMCRPQPPHPTSPTCIRAPPYPVPVHLSEHDTAVGLTGVSVRHLEVHADHRGTFREIHRDLWVDAPVVQWNVVRTVRGGMRGVHLHLVHADIYVVSWGAVRVGLRDLRRDAGSFGAVAVVDLDVAESVAVRIPPGVAHGLLALDDSLLVVGVDRYYDTADDLGCRWDDPDLGIAWRFAGPVALSDRDAVAPPFAVLQERWDAWAAVNLDPVLSTRS